MAPTAPMPGKRLTGRQKSQARLANPLIPRKTHRPDSVVSGAFLESKRDKQIIKRNSFASRVRKVYEDNRNGSNGTRQQSVANRRRRPNKKLLTTLESLGDALEEIQDEIADEDATGMDTEQKSMGRVRHRSLRSRPGALKRKEKLVKGEMRRFGNSMALLAVVKGGEKGQGVASDMVDEDGGQEAQHAAASTDQVSSGVAERFAALRSFISSTMEQNPAFLFQG